MWFRFGSQFMQCNWGTSGLCWLEMKSKSESKWKNACTGIRIMIKISDMLDLKFWASFFLLHSLLTHSAERKLRHAQIIRRILMNLYFMVVRREMNSCIRIMIVEWQLQFQMVLMMMLSHTDDPITIEYDHMLFPYRVLYLANVDF